MNKADSRMHVVVAVFLFACSVRVGSLYAQVPDWGGLSGSGTAVPDVAGSSGATAEDFRVGPFRIYGPAVTEAYHYFDPDQDAPSFYNFEAAEDSILLPRRIDHGVCYGISVFTMRYFQWFVLPHLLDKRELKEIGSRKKPPRYARLVAREMGLPAWILGEPTGTRKDRENRIRPWRLRNYMERDAGAGRAVTAAMVSAKAKEHAVRMFDNQMLLLRKGTQLASVLDRLIRKGAPAFEQTRRYIGDPRLGLAEIGFWGSRLKGMWGHSVVGYKIEKYRAVDGDGVESAAYRLLLYDSNDPKGTFDDCLWYFPARKAWAPSTKYAELYDGDNPLLPKGRDFLNPAQMGPGAAVSVDRDAGWLKRRIQGIQKLLELEENFFNVLSAEFGLEKVEVLDN